MGLPTFPPDEIRKRIVLVEKFQHKDRSWMLKWIQIQKHNLIVKQNYEEAAKWRDFEKMFRDAQEYPDNIKTFDNIFFTLYEKFEF
jgi:hypothetical protein